MTTQEPFVEVIHLLAELSVYSSYNFEKFLKKLIRLIIKIIPADSCLIYFYDNHNHKLILVGSKKTHKDLLGNIILKKGEGVAGWAIAHKQTVLLEKEAYKDERFKFFKELPEDKYEAMMSVPIFDKNGPIGVINLQYKKPYSFTKEQIETIEAIVKIISSALAFIILEQKVGHLEGKLEERKLVEKAKGIIMKAKNISEQEAYSLIRNEAMKKRKSIKEIAEAILLVFS